MPIIEKTFTALRASDVMRQPVTVIPENMSLRAAALLLHEARISGAPVVDADGKCIGILSTTDFVRWAEGGAKDLDEWQTRACLYQQTGRLLSGEESLICTLSPGTCSWQEIRPTIGGRKTAVCMLPKGARGGLGQLSKELPKNPVQRYMSTDLITTTPATLLTGVARMMFESHIHRLIVVDGERRPVGIVTSTDLLGAFAKSPSEPSAHSNGDLETSPKRPRKVK